MNYKGYVRKIGSYPPPQLEQMKADLGLKLPMPMLRLCAAYFGKQEKRDPAIEELMLLDRFSATLRNDPFAMAPIELMTNDAFVAESYADLLRKRRELFPTAKTPCSIREAFRIASLYLMRAGKRSALPNRLAILEECAEPSAHVSEDRLIPSCETQVALRHIVTRPSKDEAGDQLLLLLPSPADTPIAYHNLVSGLLSDAKSTDAIKRIRQVGENGLLYEVLQLCHGASISLPRLSRLGEPMPLSMLITAYQGRHLLRVSGKDSAALQGIAAKHGLRACHFANVLSTPRIIVKQDDSRTFSWSTNFLRALVPVRPTPVRLANEANEANAPIYHHPVGIGGCQYLSFVPEQEADVCSDGAVLTSVAASLPQRDFFRNALDTALTAVLNLAVCGAHYSEQRLAVSLTLPKNSSDPVTAGECLSAVLGIYRLQAELGIPLIADRLNTADTAHPQLTAFATASGAPCPVSLQNEGNYIYCIMPQLQGNGLPTFSELRKLLAFLSDLKKRNLLQSARILCREAITDGLSQMRTKALSCRFTGDVWAAQGAVPMAILLESSEPLAQLKQVARVVKRAEVTDDADDAVLPPTTRLIISDHATVTVVARKEDLEARKLCVLLKKGGASVTELCLSPSLSSDLLAQAIFSAGTLILCRNVELPETPEVAFAVDTLVRGGGRILLPGRQKPDERIGGIALKNGLSKKMLDQICSLKK